MTAPCECYAALLTPNGRGAVASVVVRGESATACVDACFAPASGVSSHDAALGRVLFGKWQSGQAAGEEVVAARMAARSVIVWAFLGT